jgi:hypothetical protein
MRNYVVLQEFGADVDFANKIITMRLRDLKKCAKLFRRKACLDRETLEKYLINNKITILSDNKTFERLIESLSE